MTSSVGKVEDKGVVQIEFQTSETKEVSGFIYEDPKKAPRPRPEERRLVFKADLLIVGLTSLVFLVNQWDRGNIGNAHGQFYNAISLYYIGYVICILPANLSVRFLKPHRQIGGCVVLFAILSCCMADAKNAGTVLALRIIFGFISAFLQALTIYTSMWYKKNELATRTGIFYSAATIAGGFSGLIDYAIQKNLDGALGHSAWQWLFIIEGIAGVFVGLCCWILLPPAPDQMKRNHWIFSEKEIEIAISRMKSYNVEHAEVQWKQIWLAVKDPKTTLFSFMNAGTSLALASISAFLPTFIAQFGYSKVRTQLFSVIPYACAFVTLIVVNIWSDKVNRKGVFLMGLLCTSSVGYVILIAVHNVKVKIFATCLITMGTFPGVTILGAWTSINTGGFTKRASTWGIAEVTGQCLAILGSHIYTNPPQYIKGHSIALAFNLLALIAVIICWFWMRWLNQPKEKEALEHAEASGINAVKISIAPDPPPVDHDSKAFIEEAICAHRDVVYTARIVSNHPSKHGK
ncbi:MFS general substrate transporter [Rhizodiscina lignyota]|uniref:MFS general substrate transporter n=1 Tax=Rhizodiscina lignyota TaxID=1504668 RepID=A0A9P4IE89_9PEZI|nr:MFS general substrate transporter [Rhizodiscina lignyota]